ncbi:MAG: TerC family protein [Myxococcales bacterium]|nr:TerC family protein [Myxococcales bacterium]
MEIAIWAGFLLMVIGFLALDLGVFNKKDHVIGFREALRWTLVWVAVSMVFGGAVWFLYENRIAGFGGRPEELGLDAGATVRGLDAFFAYLTGYVVEYSLSIDNIFVIALILQTFKVPRELQHRVLFWGIFGALLMRAAMIGAGAVLIHQFEWTMYLFGAILLFTAGKMALQGDDHMDVHDSWTVRTARKFYPVTKEFDGNKFFTILADGRKAMTPLMLVLLLVETTDVLFAVDSIPAVFAVTTDPFLVFTSNVFAILGLRSLFFALAGALDKFRYLKPALVVLLAFIGVKMVLAHHVKISPTLSLGVIGLILGTGVAASLLRPSGLLAPSGTAGAGAAEAPGGEDDRAP